METQGFVETGVDLVDGGEALLGDELLGAAEEHPGVDLVDGRQRAVLGPLLGEEVADGLVPGDLSAGELEPDAGPSSLLPNDCSHPLTVLVPNSLGKDPELFLPNQLVQLSEGFSGLLRVCSDLRRERSKPVAT
jgi:hypothetical protein